MWEDAVLQRAPSSLIGLQEVATVSRRMARFYDPALYSGAVLMAGAPGHGPPLSAQPLLVTPRCAIGKTDRQNNACPVTKSDGKTILQPLKHNAEG